MTNQLPAETIVRIYVGLGTQKKIIWSGKLDFIPRVGEEVVLGDTGYDVQRIHHHLPNSKSDRGVDIYVR